MCTYADYISKEHSIAALRRLGLPTAEHLTALFDHVPIEHIQCCLYRQPPRKNPEKRMQTHRVATRAGACPAQCRSTSTATRHEEASAPQGMPRSRRPWGTTRRTSCSATSGMSQA